MNILTFDIEDWFHILDLPIVENPSDWDAYESRVASGTNRLLDLLQGHDIKATFFILGWVAERYPKLVQKISARGFEIGSHSYDHRLVYRMDPANFSEDVRRSISVLSDITGKKVRKYRAPGFSITPDCVWAFDALLKNGIEMDCSLFLAKRRHGGFPDIKFSGPFRLKIGDATLKELPISFASVLGKPFIFSGGGYFRVLPKHMINYLIRRQQYVMTYFHPRDFDPSQPRLEMSRFRKWQTYVGLDSSFDKLKWLLELNEFKDIDEFDSQLDWDKTPILDYTLSAMGA